MYRDTEVYRNATKLNDRIVENQDVAEFTTVADLIERLNTFDPTAKVMCRVFAEADEEWIMVNLKDLVVHLRQDNVLIIYGDQDR